jgi:hypothetical protein
MTLPTLNPQDIEVGGEVRISCLHGLTAQYRALAVAGGLCIINHDGYTVTQVSTGLALRVNCHFANLADANAAMELLAPLFPWATGDITEVSRKKQLDLKHKIDAIADAYPQFEERP